jgi:hypothetical protein
MEPPRGTLLSWLVSRMTHGIDGCPGCRESSLKREADHKHPASEAKDLGRRRLVLAGAAILSPPRRCPACGPAHLGCTFPELAAELPGTAQDEMGKKGVVLTSIFRSPRASSRAVGIRWPSTGPAEYTLTIDSEDGPVVKRLPNVAAMSSFGDNVNNALGALVPPT